MLTILGHDIGDAVLRQVTKLFREEKARSYDMVSRWGGEEFLVICARSGVADTRQLAERLRKTIENHEIFISKELLIKLTISIGVATWCPALDPCRGTDQEGRSGSLPG